MKIRDDLGHIVKESFRLAIEQETGDVKLDPASSTMSFVGSKIQLIGNPGRSTILTLQTMFPRENYIKLEVKLADCPPGFMLNDSECVCNVDAYVGLYKCNKFQSSLIPGYWAGLIDTPSGPTLATSVHPFYMDNEHKLEVDLPQTNTKAQLNTAVCGTTRNGIACGRCQDNFTVHFNSPDFLCKPVEPAGCKFGWLFYIITELLPITLVFITILIINISFTSGAVNGFILFSQLLLSLDIDASGIADTKKHTVKHATQGYRVLYGFFNLDFFNTESLSFCLWRDASALDMLAIKYITILYTLLLIAVVTLTMNKCGGRWLGKYCRITTIKSSVIHGITTFLVICYAQCVRVSLGLITPLYLHMEKNSKYRPHLRVWFNGELLYFSKEHLPYALPAIVCLLTIGLFPPALLLTYPLLNKVLAIIGLEDKEVVNVISQKLPMSSLKPLLDSLQGSFKDNLRFFSGLYFLYRWMIPLVYIFAKDFSIYYTTVGGLLTSILMLHAFCQPHIKRAHNITDILLIADLVFIASLSFFNYHHKSNNQRIQYSVLLVLSAIVQLGLIYLPLIVMGVCLLVTFCKIVAKQGSKSHSSAVVLVSKRARVLRDLLRSINSQNENTDTNDEELPYRLIEDNW